MAKKQSAGILLYRFDKDEPQVLVAHPGGPFFTKKDDGFWSIPKGLYSDDEEPFAAAKREFQEEIGMPAPDGKYIDIGEIKRKDGKTIRVWAAEGDVDEDKVLSNSFEMEWPPKSGKIEEFPEIDRAQWFSLNDAATKLHPSQIVFLQRLAEHLGVNFNSTQNQQPSLF